jgi:hypothetical protein
MKNLSNDIFIKLMESLKCTSGDELDTVGFESCHGSYSMNFHGEMKNGHHLVVEDFGRMSVGKWVQMETTEGQRLKMQNAILNKVEEITETRELPEPGMQERYGLYSDDY